MRLAAFEPPRESIVFRANVSLTNPVATAIALAAGYLVQLRIAARRDHPADFLESLVPIDLLERVPLAHARKPARKLAPARLAARRHADGLDEFAVREKRGFLVFALKAVA